MMKKGKILAGILSVALLFCAIKLPSIIASEPPMILYVSSDGVDTNSGDKESPVKTLSAAFDKTADGATIKIVDSVAYDLGKNDIGMRIIEGTTSDSMLTYGEQGMVLYGNMILKNVTLQSQDADNAIYTKEHTLVIGKGVNYQGVAENENPVIVAGESEENYRRLTVDKTDFESGDFVVKGDTYSVVTNQGKNPVASSADGKYVYVANEWDGSYEGLKTKNALSEYSDYIAYRKGLPNTFKKLNSGEKINVIYFGGSVTVGTGAGGSWGHVISDTRDTDSWRAKIGTWLNEEYPGQVNNINEGLGESGTYMGSFRIERILEKNIPDLFFIEYSINDYYAGTEYAAATSQFETIVREIKEVNPNCDIVTVLVADSATMDGAKAGRLHTQAQAHEDISKAYNLPSLKVGSAIANKVGNLTYANDTWKRYFTDIVHPTSAGYAEYYKCIEEFMENSLMHFDYSVAELTDVKLPVQSNTLFDGDRMVLDITQELFDASTGEGFIYNAETTKYEFTGSITAANVGATFTYTFTGTETSVLTNKDSASKFTVKIDGSAYTPSAGSLAHNPITLAKGLNAGEHMVEITTKDANTTIYSIFSHDASKTTKKGADGDAQLKRVNFVLPAGSYSIKYYDDNCVSVLDIPVEEGLSFYNWYDNSGKQMQSSDVLTPGMILKARFWVNGENINPDVNRDGYVNNDDLVEMRKVLVGSSEQTYFDVNCNGSCDVRDLVALKKFTVNNYNRDNDFSVNDL